MKINIPQKAAQILKTLNAAGYEAYVVGGCVRDSILGREPGDWDITTSALPEQVKELFRRTVDTGIQHGTVTVMMDKEGFEVTTYRVDGEYHDGRHPDAVTFTRSLEEDLKRRDFTINAMAYHPEHGLVDLFGGMEDIGKRIIRCVGNPVERFTEDALRMLRAVRFSAQLGFTVEENTKAALARMSGNLEHVSAERIQTELVKLLVSEHPEKIRDAYELGITKVILPEFDAMMETTQETLHHCYNVGEHTIHALMNIPADKVLRLTMLFHDTGKPARKTVDPDGTAHFKGHAYVSEELTRSIMHRLKFDNDTLRKVSKLVLYHDDRMPATMKHVRRAMNRISAELFPYYMKVRMADTLAQSDYQRDKKLENLAGIEKCYQEILEKKQCVSLKELKVNGQDLIAAGIEKGPKIGQTLQTLLQEVIEEPEKNTREYLLARIKELE